MVLTIECEREDDGRWLAEVPQLSGVHAYGATDGEASALIFELGKEWVSSIPSIPGQFVHARPFPRKKAAAHAPRKDTVHREARFVDGPEERLVRPADFFAKAIRDLRASLTDSSVGNIFATSGLSSTRFVPSLYSSKYFPRTPRPKSSRLYSGRSSSDFLTFFINHHFFSFHETRAYNPCLIFTFCVGHDKEPLL